jgi:heme-degrading monooxygenase HmoA
VVARVWSGRAPVATADAYETHFRLDVLPELERLPGWLGAQLLRRRDGDEVEFLAVNWFEGLEAIRGFAGEDVERAVVAPAARRALSRFDERCRHYEVAVERQP